MAGCPACTRPTCPPTSCARSSSAPASTPALVDDVVWGCVSQVGEQTFDIARTAVLAAGWPETVPGTTVDRQCGSSQQAVHFAAAGLVAGQYDLVIAGGVESMSRVPMGSAMGAADPLGHERSTSATATASPTRGLGAEMIAERWGLGRAQLDEYSLESHARAAAAQDDGRLARCRSPRSRCPTAPSSRSTRASAAAGRRSRSASCVRVFKPDGVITAANSSQISDGSAALLMTTSERAAELGLTPVARVHTAVLAADDPIIMLTAPMPATRKALERSGLRLDDIGAFEVNEAFASVPLAWLADIGADPKTLNALGGAIAIGHPLGAQRRPAHDQPGAPHAHRGHPLRPADDVRGRRPGQRHHPRAALAVRRSAVGRRAAG